MKTLTYLAFIGVTAFILLVLLLKLDIIPIMNEITPQAGQARPTLIIDPGHGGEDGGAVAADGTLESGLNLQISNRLELIAVLFGVDVIKTRDGQDIVYPDSAKTVKARKTADQRARLDLIRSHPDAVLISVHQNKYTSQSPSGAQVFYARTEGSKELAEKAQELLRSLQDGASERIAMPVSDDVYIMKNAPCTAILAECGFISNPNELALLKSDKHQMILSAVLAAAYLSTGIRTEAS